MSQKLAQSVALKAKKLIQLQLKKGRPFKPVIVSDIDGVLVRGAVPIPMTLQAMDKINKLKIPFACLTNGGGQLQVMKTGKLNKSFGKQLFKAETMFMNHSPLKPQLINYSKKQGNLLVTGSLDILGILKDLKISNFVTANQLYAIYFSQQIRQEQYVYHFYKRTLTKDQALASAQDRLQRKLGTFVEEASKINSIFALNDVSPYETTLAIIHNLLKINKNGKRTLQYFAAQNDVVWAGGYQRPRLAFGPFNYILEQHCKRHNLDLIEKIYYGKPQLKAFKFVEEQMKKIEPNGVFFMMGDNPRADIRGANNIGWYSFLTSTGLHQGEQNDKQDPATFVVDNFGEAVEIILEASRHLPK